MDINVLAQYYWVFCAVAQCNIPHTNANPFAKMWSFMWIGVGLSHLNKLQNK